MRFFCVLCVFFVNSRLCFFVIVRLPSFVGSFVFVSLCVCCLFVVFVFSEAGLSCVMKMTSTTSAATARATINNYFKSPFSCERMK